MIAASVPDFREAARRRLPHFLFEYIDGGSYTETTLAANCADLAAIALRQRVMRDVSEVDPSTELFGHRHALPLVLGPVGLAGLAARRGECQAVRAAERAGIPFTLSTVGACSVGEVAAAASRPFWFQLYIMRDRGLVRELLAQAAAAGCSALVVTADMPVPAVRYRDYRSGLSQPPSLLGALRRAGQVLARPGWAWDVGVRGRPIALGSIAPRLGRNAGMNDFSAWIAANFNSAVTWRDLEVIRAEWSGPLVIKGILDPDDAREAAAIGADGIVVSNHGGRQLDGTLSTASALPGIVDAVGDRLTVLADGGVRSGLDVLRLVALGARGVLLGRAWAWALAAGGEAAVTRMLEIVEAELRTAMALSGATSVADIDRTILAG